MMDEWWLIKDEWVMDLDDGWWIKDEWVMGDGCDEEEEDDDDDTIPAKLLKKL